MKFLWLLVLVLVSIALGGLAVFAADPLLYSVDKDQAVSVFHKNPVILMQLATKSTTDMVPLMQAVIDDQKPIVVDVRLNDLDAAQRSLATYAFRYTSLQKMVVEFGMYDGEIRSFMTSTQDQADILADLITQATVFDTLKTISEGRLYKNDRDIQASVASLSAARRNTVRTLYTRYLNDHEIAMNVSTKLNLETRHYQETRVEVQKLVEMMEAAERRVDYPASLQESRITVLVVPEQAKYRDTVQILGIATPEEGERAVSLLVDGSPVKTISTDLKGNYFTNYTVERIIAGEHTISAGTGDFTSAKRILNVTKVGSVTTLTAKPVRVPASGTGANCSGSVMANHPVRNAPVKILVDGQGSIDAITGEDGSYQVFVPLSPGSHRVRAQFSSMDYPLFPSLSDEVTINVPPPPLFSLPDASSRNQFIAYGAGILVLLGAGSAAYWYVRRRRQADPAGSGLQKEPAETVRIPEDPEMISKKAEVEFPPAGSLREAVQYDAINTPLEQYETCLMEHGLPEAARQVYLTLAGRIATRLHVLAYRTLTPREMSKICRAENYAGIFYRFVGIYEKIRYAGGDSEQDRKEFQEQLQKADTEVRGDRN
jgi:hypothetical protein